MSPGRVTSPGDEYARLSHGFPRRRPKLPLRSNAHPSCKSLQTRLDTRMKVLVVGGGAREHALAAQIAARAGIVGGLCARATPASRRDVPVAPVDADDPEAVLALAASCGRRPDGHRARGSAGRGRGRPSSWRPAARCSARRRQPRSSRRARRFAKDMMERGGVPTARALVCDSADDALRPLARRASSAGRWS